jgi:ATP-dependent helicase/nuclease subunit A
MLAERIAKAVKAWLTKPDFLIGDPKTESPRRPNEGDIIVLVRSRGPLFEAILRELKQKGIAVAGADRLSLSEHIAVMDLAALCDALLLPSDDLALACALKSPLFGFTEEELFEIAHGRAGTLLSALRAAKNPKFADAVAKLERWRVEARTLRPFDFLSRVLSRDKGREKILSRLGEEASDALDELMAHALAYESSETPSLPGFLVHLRRGGSQVKRDLEVESHAVRVMTVHGVKGLEAPIILLADTTSAADSKRHHPRLMELTYAGGPILVWAAGEDSAAIERARALVTRANEDEHRRLLYVALTRARDALIVCGAESGKAQSRPAGCWYDLVRGALERDAENWKEVAAHGYGFAEKVYRWRHEPVEVKAETASPRVEEIAEPDWLRIPLVQAKTAPRAMQTPPIREGNASRGDARRRGILIHRLLQELPRFAASERAECAKRYLARTAPDLPEAMRETIAAEALAVLTEPKLSALFGPSSRAEVSILGRWKDGIGAYSDFGRVDRLAVTENEVWIADFKSDAVPPAKAAEVPQNYVLQLARYRAVLAKLYPGKAMRALVIWTANGAVHEIANTLLDKAFSAILTNEGTS